MTDQGNTTVSDELRKERGPEWCAIYDTMRHHNLTNMIFVGSDDPFCLVDLVSTIGTDISTGEEQLLILADEISLALDARRATADVTEAAERICRATGLDWESLDDTGPEDEVNGFGPETKGWFRYLARAALSSGDAIIAALAQQAPE